MKVTDLRIGNYVYGAMGELCVVCQLGNALNPNLVAYKEVENLKSWGQNGQSPIRLTSEWLSKFGFIENTKQGVNIVRINEFYHVCFVNGGKSLSVDIEYVHQVQNLFFALTGDELVIQGHAK
jgi:hypothetical protein